VSEDAFGTGIPAVVPDERSIAHNAAAASGRRPPAKVRNLAKRKLVRLIIETTKHTIEVEVGVSVGIMDFMGFGLR
jgi:hypothetical protein